MTNYSYKVEYDVFTNGKTKRHLYIPKNGYDNVDIYVFDMCMRYDKEVSVIGYTTLTGIPESIIYDWKNGSKLSQTASEIYQKLAK